MSQTVAIIANGEIKSLDLMAPQILSHEQIIAVDGGLAYCHQMKITPSLIVGDFDSCPSHILPLYPNVPKISLQKEKDETDLEIAISSVKDQWITLFGAWGGRIDHSLGNLLLLMRRPNRMKIETEDETIFCISNHLEVNCHIGQTLSLIPLYGPVKNVSTKGLKWELHKKDLTKDFFGISNICLKDTVEISVESGQLLCCVNKTL